MKKKVKKVENVPAYAENYVKKYFDLQEQGKLLKSSDCISKSSNMGLDCLFCAIPVIIVGLIYGLAFQADFLSFGIFGAASMVVLVLFTYKCHKIPVKKEGDEKNILSGYRAGWTFVDVGVGGAWRMEEILLTAFGKNVCDQITVEYFKSVMREKGKKQRRAMWLSLLAPLSAFVIGMILIAFGVGIVAKIIYPIGLFIAMVLILKDYFELVDDVYGVMNIREYACPKCHIVDKYLREASDQKQYDYDRWIKSKVGERTLGTVYDKDGKAVGSVSETYVTETRERGTRHEFTLKCHCAHCGREFIQHHSYNTNVERYTF